MTYLVSHRTRIARENSVEEKLITTALVHDIAVGGLIRCDHGFRGTQPVGSLRVPAGHTKP